MGWTMLYLFVFLKLPIVAACLILWWAIRQDAGLRRERRRRPLPAAASRAEAAARPAARPAPRAGPRRPTARPHRAGSRARDASLTARLARVITSVLSDGTIRRLVAEGRIVIEPWDEALVQPASVDLRLGDSFRVFHNHRVTAIDLREPPRNLTEEVRIEEGEAFAIHPGEFVLGRTLESVAIPEDVVARIEGKSSIGRLGLIVHATAGFVDPGFRGTLTLEITNLTRVPIKLYAGLPIAQLSFMALDQAAERPYGSPGAGLALPGPGGRHRVPLHALACPPCSCKR